MGIDHMYNNLHNALKSENVLLDGYNYEDQIHGMIECICNFSVDIVIYNDTYDDHDKYHVYVSKETKNQYDEVEYKEVYNRKIKSVKAVINYIKKHTNDYKLIKQ